MPNKGDGTALDEDAGRLIRPYALSDGRTRPTSHFDLMTMVVATPVGAGGGKPDPAHQQILEQCAQPVTVAEIAARMHTPAAVVKVLLSDLLAAGAISTRSFARETPGTDSPETDLLEAVLNGLRKRL